MKLDRNQTVLVVIDVQERLMPVVYEREAVEANVARLARGCSVLRIPSIVTEQYVKGLGTTVERVRLALEETDAYRPIEKLCFSAFGADAFSAQLAALERKQVLLTGVEAHVCVYQTALGLLGAGYAVSLVSDAVSSRTPQNKEVAIRRLMAEGVRLTSTEMALFELVGAAGTEEFRAVSRLVK